MVSTSSQRPKIKTLLNQLYGKKYDAEKLTQKVLLIISKATKQRPAHLKQYDRKKPPLWYKHQSNIAYILYADLFADPKETNKLQGAIKRLDYLQELGITSIHILPILKTSGDAGFAVDDYREVDPRFGNMKDLEAVTKEAHKRGMSIILDFVLNHTSDNHEWAGKAKAGDTKYLNYYVVDETNTGKCWPLVPDIFPEFAPGHWDYVPEIDKFLWATFYSRRPKKQKKESFSFAQWDLNYKNPEVLLSMIDNLLFLANQGIDTFRLDAVPFLWKKKGTSCTSLPEVHKILKIMRLALELSAPRATFLAESAQPPKEMLKYFGEAKAKGQEVHHAYNFSLMPTLWYAIATGKTEQVKAAIKKTNPIPKQCNWFIFDESHDEVGFGMLLDTFPKVDAKKMLLFLFSHYTKDKKGIPFRFEKGKAQEALCVSGTKWSLLGGELAEKSNNKKEINEIIKKVLLLDAVKLTIGGTPLLYSGEELGLSNDHSYKKDPAKREDSRFVKRVPLTKAALKRKDVEGTKEQKIFHGIKQMIKIRKGYEAFGVGEIKIIKTGNQSVLGYKRVLKQKSSNSILVLNNFSNTEQKAWINPPESLSKGQLVDLLTNNTFPLQKREVQLTLHPYQSVWLRAP